ncbi:MAG: hypothetical protein H0W21_10390 [Actinobacteria bacterium]|nr:hypothetical protein [Actinomycetota bacterium]
MTHTCSIDPTASMPEGMDYYSVCAGEVEQLARCAIRAAELGLTETALAPRRVVAGSLGGGPRGDRGMLARQRLVAMDLWWPGSAI